MNSLVILQLLELIDSKLDELEMTDEDIKYIENSLVQISMQKIKLICLRYALDNNLDSEILKQEFYIITVNHNENEKLYLYNYMNDLIQKMERVIKRPKTVANNDDIWHNGDEITPRR